MENKLLEEQNNLLEEATKLKEILSKKITELTLEIERCDDPTKVYELVNLRDQYDEVWFACTITSGLLEKQN